MSLLESRGEAGQAISRELHLLTPVQRDIVAAITGATDSAVTRRAQATAEKAVKVTTA